MSNIHRLTPLSSTIARGAALIADFGGGLRGYLNLSRAASKAGLSDWLITLAQGPTTGGFLGVLGLDWWIEEECE